MYDLLQLPDFTHLQFFLTCLVAFGGGLIRGYTGFAGALLTALGRIINCPIIPEMITTFNAGNGPIIRTNPGSSKRAQKNVVLSYGGGIFVGVYLGLYFLFQRDIADITFFMGIFIILATLILISGWKYQGPINNYISGSFGTGIGFFAGFFGVPTGPLTGLFFLSLKEDIKIIQANIQCIVILTVFAFFTYFYFIEGFRSDYLLLGLIMSLPLAVGLKTGQYLFNFLPEKVFRPITYICLISLGSSLCFKAYN